MATTMRSAVAGLIAAGILTPAASADPLLDRHRPVLRYDSSERDRSTAVDAIVPRLDPDRERVDLEPEQPGREVVYGHRARGGDGRTWLQYWLFFLDNPQDRGILRGGRHEGDWELVQLRLDAAGRPDRVTFAQHSWAEGCEWSDTRREGGAPVAYVANASHALYSRPKTHDRQWPDPDDEADGRGRRVRPPVVPIADRDPAWTRWPGRWGDSEAGIVPIEQSSPRGPAFQERRPWQDPSA
ncbi:MAG TPA: hypothetical protein VF517_03455, partial [Thermoleophilaceae bacterium]